MVNTLDRGSSVLRHTRCVVLAVVTAMTLAACSAESGDGVNSQALTTVPESATSSVPVATTATSVPASDATTSTMATTTSIAATTTTEPTTTTVSVHYATDPSFYPPESMSGDDASGSGCSPGAGSLPAGVWFGYVTAGNATSVQFDLACWYFGEIAWDVAATYGDTAENDYYVVNQNRALRSVPVTTGAIVHHIDPVSIGLDPIPYPDWLLGPPGYLECPFGFCPLWLYVNDGEVTEIVEQYVP